MKAIQFGAGNIGRGFVGALLRSSNYEVVFADVVDTLVERISLDKQYTVHITDVISENICIDRVNAINSMSEEIVEEIAQTDLITTAVGVNILPKIAPVIAKGIAFRKALNITKPLNIIACENTVMATDKLKAYVYELLTEEDIAFADEHVGFANCSVDRIVPPVCEANGIDVSVERFFEWNICEAELKSPLNIEGVNLVDNLEPYIERKLFTLNTGHAICAYLGFIACKDTIEEAIKCESIYKIVKDAMTESGRALVRKYNFNQEDHNAYIDKIIGRFKNPYLHDEVTRVAREPLRKLSIGDRLIKPTLTAYEYQLPVDNLLFGIAAALHFNNPDDSEAVALQEKLSSFGVRDAVADITGIQEKDLLDKIEENYYKLLEGV